MAPEPHADEPRGILTPSYRREANMAIDKDVIYRKSGRGVDAISTR